MPVELALGLGATTVLLLIVLVIVGLCLALRDKEVANKTVQHQGAARRARTRTVRQAPRPQARSVQRSTLVVERDRRPLWELRGWRRRGDTLVGAFRTPRGSFAGEISLARESRPEFYIVNPPAALLEGAHSACFRRRRDGKYHVHFGLSSPDIDAGIVGIEKLIAVAI